MTAQKRLGVRLQVSGSRQATAKIIKFSQTGDTEFRKFATAMKPANAGMQALNSTTSSLNDAMKVGAGLMGAYASLYGVFSGASAIVQTNRQFESLSAALKTATGSAQGAEDALGMIQDFAVSTPYDVAQITEAYIKLKNLGLNPTVEALTSFGNTASAQNKSLMQFIEAVADASTGEFERLKEFGIKASSQGEQVTFTFQNIKTTVAKEATEIEAYLRKIGDVNFAGSMTEQMKTLDGTFSNRADSLDKLALAVGDAGLNSAMKDLNTTISTLAQNSSGTAELLGSVLGGSVEMLTASLKFAAEYGDDAALAIGGLVAARTAGAAMAALGGSVNTTALGLRLMANVGPVASAKVVGLGIAANSATVAMRGLNASMTFLGGPAGVAILAATAVYGLSTAQSHATAVSGNYSVEMQELSRVTQDAAQKTDTLTQSSKALQRVQLLDGIRKAKEDADTIRDELEGDDFGGLMQYLWGRVTPGNGDIERELADLQGLLDNGAISVENFRDRILKMGDTYGAEFAEQALEISRQVDVYQAATMRMHRLQADLDALSMTPEHTAPSPIAEKALPVEAQKSAEDIAASLKKLQQAREDDLRNSMRWQDGLARGMDGIVDDAQDLASKTESILKSTYNGLSDAMTDFVMKGKADFEGLATDIIASLTKMYLQTMVIAPLMQAAFTGINSYFGISTPSAGTAVGTAHTGGLAGSAALMSKTVSPSVFTGAPKYHTGGMVGLKSDEVPAILQRGEGVFTRGQMQALGNAIARPASAPVVVNVNVKNSTGAQVETQQRQRPDGSLDLDVIVRQVEQQLAGNVRRGGSPLPETMEGTYALRRAGS